ncbi:heparinase II/III domain-containing protein [Paenibacillus contaminans]|uniref:Heparinase II/III-like C-terminal domain-containing protein n=1 Tax=Paenibacillus contaminans TaxID=450362 RepID=A0A329MMS3_9BACL|nr:heparinase II/III family protein [Paenibacillus contaminans]RAV21064.1 hypothetical protein DQG23_13375 [Paenibacillus contaminans]
MGSPKQKSTYYTSEKIAYARRNIAKYEWARRMKDAAVQEAESFMANGMEFLWKSVTPQTLPRGIRVHMELGSPVTGAQFLKEYGTYGWQGNPLTEPWKLTDPSSGFTFPTNDFGAYYESGLDEHGIFRKGLADPRYLVNELYPDKGASWGVDDGFGWIDEEGQKWTFIAYYNHWYLWYGAGALFPKALKAFREAYLYTGEMKYAAPGIVLLDRIADVYPDMDSSVYKWDDCYANSHGLTGKGKAIGCIWEPGLVWEFIAAYDAFFPAMEDPNVAAFLSDKASRYRLSNPKNSPHDVRRNSEDGIVRQVFPSIKEGQIRGNFGMHQRALAMAAVVLDDPEASKEWVEWILSTGGLVYEPELRVTGGNVLSTLVDEVDRDGFGNEASPTYNTIWLDQSKAVAEILEQIDPASDSNLYRHVKFKKFFDSRYPLIVHRNYTPTIGDTGKSGNPLIIGTRAEYILAYEKYKEPVYAQYAHFLNGSRIEGIQGSIFSEDPEQITRDIASVIEEHGPMKFPSRHLSGYGFVSLSEETDDKKEDSMRGLWMYYGRNTGHGHRDTLNIGLHAFGMDLMPDNGYPETADYAPKRLQWVHNTISHNTVVVNESKQNESWVGIPHHYDGESMVKLIDVEAPRVYPLTTLYRRTVAFIRADDTHSYAVDIFRVKGGQNHHYSFHGGEGEVSVTGLNLQKQATGTYAGPDIAFIGKIGETAKNYQGSGFQHLYNVERDDAPSDSFSVDWAIKDTWGVRGKEDSASVHLRLTMLGQVHEAAIADGQPPQVPGNPKSLKYMIAKRSGEQLESRFLSVIEPYKNNRFIESIESVPIIALNGHHTADSETAAVKIVLRSGRTDYVVNSIHPDVRYKVDDKFDFQGFFGVISEMDGGYTYGYLNDGVMLSKADGTGIRRDKGRIEGKITDFTKEISFHNTLQIEIDGGTDHDIHKGQWIFVKNNGKRNAAYEIKSAVKRSETSWELGIGDITLIRGYRNPNDFAEGFVYDVQENDSFTIPIIEEYAGSRK